MYAAAAPFALAYLALWNPPHWSGSALLVYALLTAIVIRALSSLFEVPSSALAAEFSTGYEQRSVLLSYRFFSAGSAADGEPAGLRGVSRPRRQTPRGAAEPAGYAHYAWRRRR